LLDVEMSASVSGAGSRPYSIGIAERKGALPSFRSNSLIAHQKNARYDGATEIKD